MKSVAALFLSVAATILALFIVPNEDVSAHANLIRSEPRSGEVLGTSPVRIVLWFSEPIEAVLSDIVVLDVLGKRVDNGGADRDPTELSAMTLPLPPLDDGAYVVTWNNVSTVDGHRIFGSFSFAVGDSEPPLVVTGVEQPLLQSYSDPWIRWIFFIGIVGATGVLVFDAFVLRRVFQRNLTRAHKRSLVPFASTVPRLVLLGLSAALIANTALLFQTASISSDGSILHALAEVALGTEWGRFWIAKQGTMVLVFLLLIAAVKVRRGYIPSLLITETFPGQAAIVVSAAVLALISLTSHSAATPPDVRLVAVLTDFMHMVSASAWVGGVAMLVGGFALTSRSLGRVAASESIQEVGRPFTPIALFAAFALVVTGTVSTWTQVNIPEALLTPYGWILLVKVGLMLILMLVAGVNNRLFRRYRSMKASVFISRLMVIELALMTAVLLAAGWLTSLEPARQYAGRLGIGLEDSVSHSIVDQDAVLELRIIPGRTGLNTIEAVLESSGGPLEAAIDARVRVRSLEYDLGEPIFSLIEVMPGLWRTEGYYLAIRGVHQADLEVTRLDGLDSRLSFRFDVAATGLAGEPIRPDEDTAWLLLGTELIALGLFLMLLSFSWRRRLFSKYSTVATGVVVLGIFALSNLFLTRAGLDANIYNPNPATSESVSNGAGHFSANCAACHGESGLGDGESGGNLSVPPADLTIHVPLHTEEELFFIVSDGIETSGMPAYRAILSEGEIWDLVNFLRVLTDSELREDEVS